MHIDRSIISYIKKIGINVTVNNNPSKKEIKRIKKRIIENENKRKSR